jgi:hypothetical protein
MDLLCLLSDDEGPLGVIAGSMAPDPVTPLEDTLGQLLDDDLVMAMHETLSPWLPLLPGGCRCCTYQCYEHVAHSFDMALQQLGDDINKQECTEQQYLLGTWRVQPMCRPDVVGSAGCSWANECVGETGRVWWALAPRGSPRCARHSSGRLRPPEDQRKLKCENKVPEKHMKNTDIFSGTTMCRSPGPT